MQHSNALLHKHGEELHNESYNGQPFLKKAYQIQIWPNKFHFLNFALHPGITPDQQLNHSWQLPRYQT